MRSGLQCDCNRTQPGLQQHCGVSALLPTHRFVTKMGKRAQWGRICESVFILKMRVSAHPEPCPPTAVQATMDCEQLNSTVSWQRSDLAVGYVAYFENRNGHCISCVARDTDASCQVSELMCGTVYRVTVKTLGQQYNSSDSTAFSLTSGKHQHCGKTYLATLPECIFVFLFVYCNQTLPCICP